MASDYLFLVGLWLIFTLFMLFEFSNFFKQQTCITFTLRNSKGYINLLLNT